MENVTKKYMDMLAEHLQEHRASVLVGAGFSRNAVKIDDSVSDSPTWAELCEIFIDKLGPDSDEKKELEKVSPLILAERIEAIYGRPELDRLLLSSIRDTDFLPSSLHRKLLRLPWSDIFTTNYDTLLERASEELTEQVFTVVTCKEDLIGSSGAKRIIKLHGSFPSHRPFIISSEDYRTYPQRFAPFVNTVQQSMLENTLCLIGFSGDDPNFEKWIGWIRDNLGIDNAPNIYLLLHKTPSEAEKKLLFRKKIIPIDLSELIEGQDVSSISSIYEVALDYLFERQHDMDPGRWDLIYNFHDKLGHSISLQEALEILQRLHNSYPGWLTVPSEKLQSLRRVIKGAQSVLKKWCREDPSTLDWELEYLYEYDWLREKTLLPPDTYELECYHKILKRHGESYHKYAIQLSLLRDLRESGDWSGWEILHDELQTSELSLNSEQSHQFRWEECLYSQSQYRFQELKQRLEDWTVESSTPVWVLRKAGLLAECGNQKEAQTILRQAISDIRRRLTHQNKVNLALLSLESAMMVLYDFVSQALESLSRLEGESTENAEDIILADRHQRALHNQYYVDWSRQNSLFDAQLEAPWEPFHIHRKQPSFDFGGVKRSNYFGEDTELVRAYTFLRFREETGIPFFINSTYLSTKAACGAAERIARYSPFWSILILVRADEPKKMERVITRSILSTWTQDEADRYCQFYLKALLRTEDELSISDGFYRRSFVRLVADVLPHLLSELCSKCSYSVLTELLDMLKQLYSSEKRECYTEVSLLTRRLLAVYPKERHRELARQLLAFPIISDVRDYSNLRDPIFYLSATHKDKEGALERSLPEVEILFDKYRDSTEHKETILTRLLCGLNHGLLTQDQKFSLRDILWNDQQFCAPKRWLRTICLELPPPENVDVRQYLAHMFVEEIDGYTGTGIRPSNDMTILDEIQNFIFSVPNAFRHDQIQSLLHSFCVRVRSLSTNLVDREDFMGIQAVSRSQMYRIAHLLWLLTGNSDQWNPSDDDLQCMGDISEILDKVNVRHCGLYCAWHNRANKNLNMANELSECFGAEEEQNARWGFETLVIGILRPEFGLLEESVMCAGIAACAQQILWGTPKSLAFALRAVNLAAGHKPELISPNTLEAVLSGLSQIEKQTIITIEDTIETASNKGSIRRDAAALAKTLHDAQMWGDRPEILFRWIDVINDKDEFAEIRNAGSREEY